MHSTGGECGPWCVLYIVTCIIAMGFFLHKEKPYTCSQHSLCLRVKKRRVASIRKNTVFDSILELVASN